MNTTADECFDHGIGRTELAETGFGHGSGECRHTGEVGYVGDDILGDVPDESDDEKCG